ncbi:MAG TPA: hydantoinase/oxoprolinase family protein [Gammaproteobacteria bacterium]|nr:hydantoinase/oxoprolinase family protein [Gammaproteobacteria bacterium]
MSFRVGVDIGGTFTDFCAFNDVTNEIHTLKVLSSPDKPGSEVIDGIKALGVRYGVSASDVVYFTHGTTIGVNTVIQRKGIRLGLLVTRNFTDVLELARLKMPDMYSLLSVRPEALITKDRIFEVSERIRADGSIEQEVDPATVERSLADAQEVGCEGIVIALINSYRNSHNEQAVKAMIQRLSPGFPVFCSTDVWPIIREYERTVTAVIHGYVQPRVSQYLESLQQALLDAKVNAIPQVTKSNGGVMSAELGRTACAQMILSGTAAGVIGASHVSKLSGHPNTMSLDIGGTSADVAFIRDGQPQFGIGEVIGEFPIFIPSVAVTSIGAGGGSIAWVDDLGILRVGPESAGSKPGPACYGNGGKRATITDAFVVLGYIGQFDLGYSAIEIDVTKARSAVDVLAEKIGKETEETAQAIVDIAVSGMYMEISKLISRYAVDPREYALQAFGGAGPMMACFVARELGMKTIIIPTTPGVLSALGGLIADIKNDFIKTVFVELGGAETTVIQEEYKSLEDRALEWLREEQAYEGDYQLIYSADMRYRGQAFEIEAILSAKDVASGDVTAMAEAFHREHELVYEHCDRDAAVQIVNLRLVIVGASPKPIFPEHNLTVQPATPERTVEVFTGGRLTSVSLFRREQLHPGFTFDGPAIVVQSDCTSCVPEGLSGNVDAYGNLVLHADH